MTDLDTPSQVRIGGLLVADELRDFIEREALPAAGDRAPSAEAFWSGLEAIVAEFGQENRALLEERDRLQSELDAWYREHRGLPADASTSRAHLETIGYLVPDPPLASVTTTDVDPEIAETAGPQLVVPVTNARYALNAANARWGSLYDALYGTDALPGTARPGGYDAERGAQVVAAVRALLDRHFPLVDAGHAEVIGYAIEDGALVASLAGGRTRLATDALRGWRGDPDRPDAVLLEKHGLHWELQFDRESMVGRADRAGMSDVLLESALTTIVDFEDSVAVVDASDKVAAYRNWLGLNRGDLEESFEKGGARLTRRLADDRVYRAVDGGELVLPGRALLFVRDVGHLMTTDAVLDADGRETGEGILDTVVTALCAIPGTDPRSGRRNGTTGSIYIVKPKMHGPAEVAFTVRVFAAVENLLGLAPDTIKLGLMDEERRTSVNLASCIAAATTRLVFVNTGFLDRSGDEIHTSMEAGPIVRKSQLRTQSWMSAYETRNVAAGLAAGLPGHGQIGKGMWAAPDRMADMLVQKVAHPRAGASTAWVPSPTAATLHALHYAEVDVRARQQDLADRATSGSLDELLTLPLGDPRTWSDSDRQQELDENLQSLLGYVVRWVDQGIGCSKVPDIHDVGLMEDRATLRISSQLVANWLHHRIVTSEQVDETLRRMAEVVDAQNAGDPAYRPMAPACDGPAFRAAHDLVFEGVSQPNGYTEPILHRARRAVKASAGVVA